MLTLFHAPQSRSTSITALIEEMGIKDWIDIRRVGIRRGDGSGAIDPHNPHPEGKVPALVHDGHIITERGAIILHLCLMFPDSGLSPAPGTADWGRFAAWLFWYAGVVEPVFYLQFAGIDDPMMTGNFRDPAAVAARISAALKDGPFLLGDRYSAADLLIHGIYAWKPDLMPDDPAIRAWVERCGARPAGQRAWAADVAV
jgi:glutathione S-transferase